MSDVSRNTRSTQRVELNSNDSERTQIITRLAVALGILALIQAVVVIVLMMASLLPGTLTIPIIITTVFAALLIVITFVVSRTKPQVASHIFTYGAIGYCLLLMYCTGGIHGPAYSGFMIPIMAAGLFGAARSSIRLMLVSFAAYIAFALLQIYDILPVPEITESFGRTGLFVAHVISIGTLLTYIATLWSKATSILLAQAQEQSEALLGSNEKLMEKNFQQVELGSELSTAAAELLAASHQQASGATEQASAVSQVSTTIEELGSTARQIAIAAEQVAEAAQQTLENLSEGQDAVDRSIQAMERIRHRMQDVSTRVLSLGERSQQIGEIIDIINDISDETHLLALNAAIEAAGAGEHGRRFAVVAAEVKSLANRALEAAKEVKGVIAEIQQATNAAVLAAEEGGKEVERGVELAHSAGQVMDSIVMVAERTAQSGAEINLATAQQQSASEQVVETMREVADVARQTASGARQMSESAQMLTAIAERLHGIVYETPQINLGGDPDLNNRLQNLDRYTNHNLYDSPSVVSDERRER